jgi:hypothetical protein
LSTKPNAYVSPSARWNFSSSSDMKNRNRIGDIGDPCGIPVCVGIQSVVYPGVAIRVRLPVRKLATILMIHSGSPFLQRIQRRRSWETLSNAPARSLLLI